MAKGRGGWPSKTDNPSGKGRDNNPPSCIKLMNLFMNKIKQKNRR